MITNLTRAFPVLFPALLVFSSWKAAAADSITTGNLRLSSPRDYQVIQRATRASGLLPVTGSLPQSDRQRILELRLLGDERTAPWRKAAVIMPGSSEFQTELATPSGGWYRLEARVGGEEAAELRAAVEHVGVGEVFVIAGQSNSANHGEEKQQPATGLVSALADGRWDLARDPQPGASGNGGSFIPPFADALCEIFKVPVGIIAAGVGATSVREWLPRGTPFPNPPTLTGHVLQRPDASWESDGTLFENLVARMRQAGPGGFRAVLWHQGESDAHQQDSSRTLTGELYRKFLEQLIRDSGRALGRDIPWFVAQASYHTPDDPGSPEIRAAQQALWTSGAALEGPDTDALTGELRDNGGKGVHFSGKGLHAHGARWAEKVAPWLAAKLAASQPSNSPPHQPELAKPSRIRPGETEDFIVEGRGAFVYLPPAAKRSKPQPWIFYAPALPPYPDEAERWMHERFLEAGIAVAGIDAGESHGSPQSLRLFDALHRELTGRRGFAPRPCLLGRSRGGLWISSWAVSNPRRTAGIAGIYPVFDFRSYPGITNAARAYGLTPPQLEERAAELNPVSHITKLAEAGIPALLIHGDSDKVVPIGANSGEFVRLYTSAGAASLVKLIVLEGQGQNFFEGFFHSQALVDFTIARAREGAKP